MFLIKAFVFVHVGPLMRVPLSFVVRVSSGMLKPAEEEVLLGLKKFFRLFCQTRNLLPNLSYHRSKNDLLKDA